MRLSIVAPCYNEAANIAELRRQLGQVANRLRTEAEFGIDEIEYVLVDDGSRDTTLEQLKAWAATEPGVLVVSLSRNFGHQAALSAGIDHATGDAVVVMDADLQHPPDMIIFKEAGSKGGGVAQVALDRFILVMGTPGNTAHAPGH